MLNSVPILPPFRTTPVLPSVYDDSLSYIETLTKLWKKVDDCVEILNQCIDFINTYDDRLTGVEEEVVALRGEFVSFKAFVQKQIDDFEAEVEQDFAQLNADLDIRFNGLVRDINRLFEQFKVEVRQGNAEFQQVVYNEVTALNGRIDLVFDWVEITLRQFLENLPESFVVVSPFSGQIVSVQEAINELYDNASRFRAITCAEFDSLGLTASEFDALELTAWQFDVYGLDYLPIKDEKHNMYSPFTGEWVSIKSVVEDLATLHRLYALTCSEFDGKELTVDEFEVYDMTAYQFDWNAKQIIV